MRPWPSRFLLIAENPLPWEPWRRGIGGYCHYGWRRDKAPPIPTCKVLLPPF